MLVKLAVEPTGMTNPPGGLPIAKAVTPGAKTASRTKVPVRTVHAANRRTTTLLEKQLAQRRSGRPHRHHHISEAVPKRISIVSHRETSIRLHPGWKRLVDTLRFRGRMVPILRPIYALCGSNILPVAAGP